MLRFRKSARLVAPDRSIWASLRIWALPCTAPAIPPGRAAAPGAPPRPGAGGGSCRCPRSERRRERECGDHGQPEAVGPQCDFLHGLCEVEPASLARAGVGGTPPAPANGARSVPEKGGAAERPLAHDLDITEMVPPCSSKLTLLATSPPHRARPAPPCPRPRRGTARRPARPGDGRSDHAGAGLELPHHLAALGVGGFQVALGRAPEDQVAGDQHATPQGGLVFHLPGDLAGLGVDGAQRADMVVKQRLDGEARAQVGRALLVGDGVRSRSPCSIRWWARRTGRSWSCRPWAFVLATQEQLARQTPTCPFCRRRRVSRGVAMAVSRHEVRAAGTSGSMSVAQVTFFTKGKALSSLPLAASIT